MLDPDGNLVQIVVTTQDNGVEVGYVKCWLTPTMAANMRDTFDLSLDMLKGYSKHTTRTTRSTDSF